MAKKKFLVKNLSWPAILRYKNQRHAFFALYSAQNPNLSPLCFLKLFRVGIQSGHRFNFRVLGQYNFMKMIYVKNDFK